MEELEFGVSRGQHLCVCPQRTGSNSHIKAQVLLLLKEVVQDVLPDKVWV